MLKLLPIFIFYECRNCKLIPDRKEFCPCVKKDCYKTCYFGCIEAKYVFQNIPLLMELSMHVFK